MLTVEEATVVFVGRRPPPAGDADTDEADSFSSVMRAPTGSSTPVPSDMTTPAEWLGIGGGGGDTPELSELVGTGSGATAAPALRCNAATAAAPVRAVAEDP